MGRLGEVHSYRNEGDELMFMTAVQSQFLLADISGMSAMSFFTLVRSYGPRSPRLRPIGAVQCRTLHGSSPSRSICVSVISEAAVLIGRTAHIMCRATSVQNQLNNKELTGWC